MIMVIWAICILLLGAPVFLFAYLMSYMQKDHSQMKRDFELWAFNGPLEGRDRKELVRKFWNEKHPKYPVFVTDHLEDALGMMIDLYGKEKQLTKSQIADIKKKMYR